MAEKIIMKEYKEQVKAEKLWDNRTFANLMEYSAVEAAQYCVDCGIDTIIHGMSAADYVKANGVVPVKIEVVEEIVETPVETPVEEIETPKDDGLTKEDIQELLKSNNIKFSNLLGMEKLVKLAQENGLL